MHVLGFLQRFSIPYQYCYLLLQCVRVAGWAADRLAGLRALYALSFLSFEPPPPRRAWGC